MIFFILFDLGLFWKERKINRGRFFLRQRRDDKKGLEKKLLGETGEGVFGRGRRVRERDDQRKGGQTREIFFLQTQRRGLEVISSRYTFFFLFFFFTLIFI